MKIVYMSLKSRQSCVNRSIFPDVFTHLRSRLYSRNKQKINFDLTPNISIIFESWSANSKIWRV